MSKTALRKISGLKGLRLCSCKGSTSICNKQQGAKRQAALVEFLVLIKKDKVSICGVFRHYKKGLCVGRPGVISHDKKGIFRHYKKGEFFRTVKKDRRSYLPR